MNAEKLKFKAELLLAGKTATGIQVPEDIIERLNAGKRPPVKVTINGYTYQNTIAVMNGAFMLAVSNEVREKTGIRSGDMVEVQLEPDTQPRHIQLPDDFKNALEQEPDAKLFFESLSNTNKKRYVMQIESAKTLDTKKRRINKAIADLREKKKI